MMICKRCRVVGRVQGVFYRASTQEQARQLDVSGWARNMPDGSVEVLACGEQRSVEALSRWLWDGPRMAEVDDVRCQEEPYQGHSSFGTG